jgi:hypothetical protein
MTAYRRLAVALVAATALISATGRAAASPPPGPPWPADHPPSKERPATDAPGKDFCFADVAANGAPVGVGVKVTAAVARPKVGNKYELYYQLRVHTQKGEVGPLLGTKEFADGKPFLLRQVTCEYDWIEFYEEFDVTRKDVSGMTNLPAPASGGPDKEVMIRVEPQLFDVAEKKYVTPAKTPAAIVVATVGARGKVSKLQSLSAWLVEKGGPGWDPKKAVAVLADLDEFGTAGNGVEDAIHTVLGMKDVSPETKVLFINAVPPATLNWKSSYPLKRTLEGLASGTDKDLKAAAQKKLDEAK